MAIRLHRHQYLDADGNRNMVTLILLAAVLILTGGCAPVDMDQIMGRTDGTPTTTTQSIDCDLIFPAPSKDTLAP
jgi:hypothetical protein